MNKFSDPIFAAQYARSRNVWLVVEYCEIFGARHQAAVHQFTTERAARRWLSVHH